MSGDIVAMLVGVVASLFLASRSLRAHDLSFEKKAAMIAAWVVIIAVLAFAFDRFAG